jgi:superoxide dismutase, Cu-Zn family
MTRQWPLFACGMAAALSVAALATGCSEDDEPAATTDGGTEVMIGQSTGAWIIFPMPFPAPRNTEPNPITTIEGTAQLFTVGGKTKVKLTVDRLPPNRPFGVHVHKLSCAEMSAGPHYQHNETPDGGSRTDNAYANPTNEIWLDLTTDAQGKKTVEHLTDWIIVKEKAKAIIVHDMLSSTAVGMGGTAGARLACLNLSVP